MILAGFLMHHKNAISHIAIFFSKMKISCNHPPPNDGILIEDVLQKWLNRFCHKTMIIVSTCAVTRTYTTKEIGGYHERLGNRRVVLAKK